MFRLQLLSLFLLLNSTLLSAQGFWSRSDISLGIGIINEQLPEGVAYKPNTLLAASEVFRRKHFSISAELQFVHAVNQLNRNNEWEGGLNAVIGYDIPISTAFKLRAAIGSGPHYLSLETRRQASGFIFSDNFELGGYISPKNSKLRYLLKARFRHISNAGLKSPNGGIDNFFLVIGVGGAL